MTGCLARAVVAQRSCRRGTGTRQGGGSSDQTDGSDGNTDAEEENVKRAEEVRKDQDGKKDDKPEMRFEIKVPTNAELAANLKGALLLVHGEIHCLRMLDLELVAQVLLLGSLLVEDRLLVGPDEQIEQHGGKDHEDQRDDAGANRKRPASRVIRIQCLEIVD